MSHAIEQGKSCHRFSLPALKKEAPVRLYEARASLVFKESMDVAQKRNLSMPLHSDLEHLCSRGISAELWDLP
jgi:hypothetical protein